MNTNDQAKIIGYIDQLIKMSGVKDDPSTLDIERKTIEMELAAERSRLASLKSVISPERYYNANEAIVNNAIESSLVRRNQSLELEIKEKREQISTHNRELTEAEAKSVENSDNIARSQRCIDTLEARINESGNLDPSTLAHYQALISKTGQGLNVFYQEDSVLNAQITNLSNAIAKLESEIHALQTVIDTNNNYLTSTKTAAANYDGADYFLKARDEQELREIESRIADLEAKRDSITNNPVLIAEKAKRYLVEDEDTTLALVQITKLVDVVAEKEYMNIPYSKDFDEEIKQLLAEAEKERNDFAASLDGKSYVADSSELDRQRKEYLEARIAFYQQSISSIRDIITQIDANNGMSSTTNVEKVEACIADMEKVLASYASIDPDIQLKPAEIMAATNRKENQIETAQDLLGAYQSDVISDVALAAQFETQQISALEKLIANAQSELNSVESRINLNKNPQEDFVAQAIDNAKLAKLAGRVIAIKYRKKFKESPRQILDSIEEIVRTYTQSVAEPSIIPTLEDGNISFAREVQPISFINEPVAPAIEKETALKVDHILDLAEPKPTYNQEIDFKPIDVTTSHFEPVAPIDLETYVSPITPSPRYEEVDTKRGNKVIDVTPIVVEEKKQEVENPFVVTPVAETNPFTTTDGNLFDFNGDLLGSNEKDLDSVIDFNTAADEVTLGLGKVA